MVYRGRPSTACHMCRTRRIKVRCIVFRRQTQPHIFPIEYHLTITSATRNDLVARNARDCQSTVRATGVSSMYCSETRMRPLFKKPEPVIRRLQKNYGMSLSPQQPSGSQPTSVLLVLRKRYPAESFTTNQLCFTTSSSLLKISALLTSWRPISLEVASTTCHTYAKIPRLNLR